MSDAAELREATKVAEREALERAHAEDLADHRAAMRVASSVLLAAFDNGTDDDLLAAYRHYEEACEAGRKLMNRRVREREELQAAQDEEDGDPDPSEVYPRGAYGEGGE